MRIIVFDLDDTLYSTYTPFEKAFSTCFPGYSSMEMRRACKAMRSYSESLLDLRTQGLVSPKDLYIGRMDAALKAIGGNSTPEEALYFQDRYEYQQAHVSFLPGMKEVLDVSRSGGLVAILTNGPSEGQRRKLNALHMDHWVIPRNIFISEEIGYCKPHIEAFSFLAEKMGALPEETLMIGDSLSADMIGASKMGWQTFWFNWQQKDQDQAVELTKEIHTTQSLKEEIGKWIAMNQYSFLLPASGWDK